MTHASPYRAVLFDVGGPVDMEEQSERLIDSDILRAVAAAGKPRSVDAAVTAEAAAVTSFAPDTYAAMILDLTARCRPAAETAYRLFLEGSERRMARRGGIEVRPGIRELLADLRASGARLGLAANQPSGVAARLEDAGLLAYFEGGSVSGNGGFRKPDPRLFLAACRALDVAPQECVMVGDRIDNDIASARMLGMGTVLLRTGRHRSQKPRSWREVPDAEVHNIAEMREALVGMGVLHGGQR